MYFLDRKDAGLQLAKKLISYKNHPNTIVLGLPRGGVVTAAEIAKQLQLPLDIICARKIGAPNNPELAIGAVTETGEGYFNQDILDYIGVSSAYIQTQIEQEKKEAERRLRVYRQNRPPLNLKGKTAILVDDGIATGATMKASIQSVKASGADKIIVAAPVSAIETFDRIKEEVDEAIVLTTPIPFYAVGEFYRDFSQTTDKEVIDLLNASYRTCGK